MATTDKIYAAVQNNRTGKVVGYLDVSDQNPTCAAMGSLFPEKPGADALAKLLPALPAGNWGAICGMVFAEASKADFEDAPDPGDGTGFDNSYSYTLVGEDYNGTDFVDDPHPKIVAVDRALPRLTGNDYVFIPQTAQNTFPPRRLPPTPIKGMAVNYVGMDVNDGEFRSSVLGRGYNTVSDTVPNRGLYSREDLMVNINSARGEADIAANGLKDGNGNYVVQPLPDSDPRKAPLQQWATQDKLSVDPAVCDRLGRRILLEKQNTDWTAGKPLKYITLNFENHTAPTGSGLSDEQARMDAIGLVMRGVRNQALDMGQTPPTMICYDHGGLCHYNLPLISKDITTANGIYTEDGSNTPYTNAPVGVPAYYLPGRLGIAVKGGTADAPMATTNEMIRYAKEFGAILGSQEYPNSTTDNQSFWVKGNDGKPVIRTVTNYDGQPVKLLTYRTDARRTNILGEVFDMLGPAPYYICEAAAWLEEVYTRATYVTVQYDVRAGNQFMAMSNVRQSGFEKLMLVMWTCMKGEFKQDYRLREPDDSGWKINPATGQRYDKIVLNTRPLNPNGVELDLAWSGVMGLLDAYRNWIEPEISISEQGDSFTGRNHARGNYEVQQKALNRYSEVEWIKFNTVRPMLGELPIRNFSRDRAWHNYNDEFEKKMLMGGVFCPSRADKNNKPWIVLCGAYPAQDVDMSTTVTLWPTDTNGVAIGGSYTFKLSGRQTYLEAFQLPDAYAGLGNAQWRYQYTDLTGDIRTRTMDWRTAIPTTNLTPPAPAV